MAPATATRKNRNRSEEQQGLATQKLIDYLQDAHAMEQSVAKLLDSMIATTKDRNILSDLKHHREETDRHIELLEGRLKAHGEAPSARKEIQSNLSPLFKTVIDSLRGDKPAKNARDGFITEHMEIATYKLLEQLAVCAEDEETAEVARRNMRDEEAMARKIDKTWEKVVDLSISAGQ